MAGQSRLAFGETVPSELRNKWAMTMRQPLGVAGIITPWNFPLAIPTWKIFPALLCGNAVVFKPAEIVPGSAHALSEIIARSGIAPGVFNLVMGSGSVVGQTLIEHPDVAAVSFTGSVATGRRIAQACVVQPGVSAFG